MPDFMPSYVYSDDDSHKVAKPKPVPEGAHKCDGCNGSGVYYGAGSVVNGKFVGFSGKCYRCGGKGHQTAKDVKRNRYYDNHVRRFPSP
jgi:DnaJ-class molecular chaperone